MLFCALVAATIFWPEISVITPEVRDWTDMKTQSIFSRGRLSASVAPVVLGLAMISMPAFAQTAPAAEDEVAADGDPGIVVTGSLITNPNLKLSSPVSVVTAEEVELRQTNVAEEFLRQLPSSIPSIGSTVNNGNGGNSFVNLRGIGSNRNLVLLDGRRIVPADLAGRTDLNSIPLALVERTDILTGGATTTYGADAVSGVINFITKRDFSGIEATIADSITEKGDGNTFRTDVTIGANFDDGKGNAVFSVGYQESDPVFQGDRAFGVTNIGSFSNLPAGSGTAVPSRISSTRGLNAAGVPNLLPAFLQTGVNAAGMAILTPNAGGAANGGVRQIDPATGRAIAPFSSFNFNPFNLFQTPFERFNIFGQARYEISDKVEVYTQGLFSKNTVKTIIAPSGSFGSSLNLPLSNPFLPAATRNQLCALNVAPNVSGINSVTGMPVTAQVTYVPLLTQAQCDAAALARTPTDPNFRELTVSIPRRFVEAGTRNTSFTTTIFNYTLGFRGDLTDNIRYDVSGSYGESENISRQDGQGLLSRLQRAVRATNPNTCIDTDGGSCVPINLFGPQGSITAASLGYVAGVGTTGSTNASLSQVKGIISGDTGSFSLAETPIGFAVGVEYRKYGASSLSDLPTQTPNEVLGSGAASPDIFGTYNVKEAFGELIIPVFEDESFAKNLTIELGGRYSDYSTAGKNYTYKGAIGYEPIDGLKFRGNYQRGARAPNIGELFNPQVTGLIGLTVDPCASFNTQTNLPINNPNLGNADFRAICIAQGATLNQIGSIGTPSAGQANQTSGGNPNLKVEKTTTYTVGAVWQPSFIPKLSISVDYFNIKVTGAISTPTAQDVLAACFGTPAGTGITAGSAASAACSTIRRNPLTGGLDGGDTSVAKGLPLVLSNLGRITTDGIDVSINYSRDLGFADYSFSFDGTWNNSNKFQATPTSLNRECIGFISSSCAPSQPEFSWVQRTSLTFADRITASLLWRHTSKLRQEPDDIINGNGPACGATGNLGNEPMGNPGCTGVDFSRIKATDYYDLSGRFELSDNVTLTVTVQNLLDKQPKFVGSGVGGATFNSGNVLQSNFDTLGRRYAASVKFKF
jgi:iron complex outermembrane recepter protein